jgi:hypothetical protein
VISVYSNVFNLLYQANAHYYLHMIVKNVTPTCFGTYVTNNVHLVGKKFEYIYLKKCTEWKTFKTAVNRFITISFSNYCRRANEHKIRYVPKHDKYLVRKVKSNNQA